MNILIVYRNQNRAYALAKEFSTELAERGAQARIIPISEQAFDHGLDNDLVIVLGGDGTILGTARALAGTGIPLLGVNLGRIGFLSSINPVDWPQTRDKLLKKQFDIEDRMMIDVAVVHEGRENYLGTSLNDAIIRTRVPHTISVHLAIDDQIYASYRGDGIICATSTGSSAYNYSAGGPLIYHQLEALAVTPICPQLSCARALLLPGDMQLKFTIDSKYEVGIALDGKEEMALRNGDWVTINKSAQTTCIARINTESCVNKIARCRSKI